MTHNPSPLCVPLGRSPFLPLTFCLPIWGLLVGWLPLFLWRARQKVVPCWNYAVAFALSLPYSALCPLLGSVVLRKARQDIRWLWLRTNGCETPPYPHPIPTKSRRAIHAFSALCASRKSIRQKNPNKIQKNCNLNTIVFNSTRELIECLCERFLVGLTSQKPSKVKPQNGI